MPVTTRGDGHSCGPKPHGEVAGQGGRRRGGEEVEERGGCGAGAAAVRGAQ